MAGAVLQCRCWGCRQWFFSARSPALWRCTIIQGIINSCSAYGLFFFPLVTKVWRLAMTKFPRHEDDSADPPDRSNSAQKTKTQMFIPLHVNLRSNYSKWRPYISETTSTKKKIKPTSVAIFVWADSDRSEKNPKTISNGYSAVSLNDWLFLWMWSNEQLCVTRETFSSLVRSLPDWSICNADL